MPISVQEVVLNDQLDQKDRRLEPCVTRWEENDQARKGHEGENEIEYCLEQGKQGGEERERCMQCNKYGELKIEGN